jgi:hypothetical protein
MRGLSFAVHRSPGFATRDTDSHAPPSPSPKMRRRLVDAIDDAFRLALSRGDTATAGELLAVLQGIQERERIKTPTERRRGDLLLECARRDLDARKAARYNRY